MTDNSTIRDYVLTLWDEGHSASQIVRIVHNKMQIVKSRNAIIGIIMRAGKQRGGGVGSKVVRNYSRDRQAPKPIPIPIPKANEPEPIGPIGDFPKRGECQYIKGESLPAEKMQACGHKTKGPNISWCDWHLANTIYNKDYVYSRKPKAA